MVLPLLPVILIGAGAVTGGTGVVAGGRGAYKMVKARREVAGAQRAYEHEYQRTQQAAALTNQKVRALGAQQEQALADVVVRFAEFIRRNERQVAESMKLVVDGLEVEIHECGERPSTGPQATSLLLSMVGAGSTGAATAAGTTAAVTALGTASTGTSLSALSGAAAHNATLAALGGGSLATGGGGMALGAVALNFVTVGPALLIGGMALNGSGEKALTAATKYAAQLKVEGEEIRGMRTVFATVEKRVAELEQLLRDLVTRAVDSLASLEACEGTPEGFEPGRDASLFQSAVGLTVAVRDVATTPVVADDGTPNAAAARLAIKYRELAQ
jgi:hypothetical protein